MTRIHKISLEQRDAIQDAQRRQEFQQPLAQSSDESVVANVKPEIDNPGDAFFAAAKILTEARRSPAQAVAVNRLDEARVKALLSED